MKELLNEFEKDYNVLNFTEIQEKYFIKLLDALYKENIALVYHEPKNQSNYRADISYTQYWIKAADIIELKFNLRDDGTTMTALAVHCSSGWKYTSSEDFDLKSVKNYILKNADVEHYLFKNGINIKNIKALVS